MEIQGMLMFLFMVAVAVVGIIVGIVRMARRKADEDSKDALYGGLLFVGWLVVMIALASNC